VNIPAPFIPVTADWQRDRTAIHTVRTAVFIHEQAIPAALEWDSMDGACEHVLVFDAHNQAIATGRLQPDGRIGRMAVLRHWRGRGIGSSLLCHLEGLATARGLSGVYVHAQLGAECFYRKAGFRRQGEIFVAAGIRHVRMSRGIT